jgi:hypothetical protein
MLSRSTDDRGVSEATFKLAQYSHKDSGKASSATLIGGRQILDQTRQYVVLDQSGVAPGTITARQKVSSSSSHLSTASNAGPATPSNFPSIAPLVSPDTLLSEGNSESITPTRFSDTTGDDMVAASWLNTLPNRRLMFDLQSLNLHLSIRVTEILACAEAMWEWVCEFQDSQGPHRGRQPYIHKENALSRNVHPGEMTGTHRFRNELKGLSRAEFDVLLTRFDLCVPLFYPGVIADADGHAETCVIVSIWRPASPPHFTLLLRCSHRRMSARPSTMPVKSGKSTKSNNARDAGPSHPKIALTRRQRSH